ncbi:MAG TPA: permease-like cell division protein FtsX [Candidatus Paceibacterota bacterium]|jgi:cell division transport system permease protein|nr:permease-like cell division protein FtsX [Candidatus Paceibacterota bacterium]
MFTVISRIFHFGFKNFWRNGWLSLATIAITTLALLVFISLIMFGVITRSAANSIESKIDISVYFKQDTSEDQILSIQQALEGLSQVANVNYISQDQALANFEANHSSDQTISQAVNELSTNPLEASLNIQATNPNDYGDIANYLATPDLAQYIDSVSYTENQDVIERLAKIVTTVNLGGYIIAVILALIAGLVVFNTIRLAIYSNRDEIGIMRVVGASNVFIRGPYVVEGMITGAIAAVAGLILIAPLIYFTSPYLDVFIPGLSIFQYFYTHILWLLLYELLFGVGIGMLSSFVAVRRYLRN